jgi:hypothetical protein
VTVLLAAEDVYLNKPAHDVLGGYGCKETGRRVLAARYQPSDAQLM